jgi:cytochrome c-type biogenesis protein CcmH
MTLFVVIGTLLALLTLALLTRPLWRRRGATRAEETGVASLRQQLEQLAALRQSGVLSAVQYDEARQALERGIADAIAKAPATASPPLTAKPLLYGLTGFVCAVAVAGYAWLGTPRALNSELVAAAPPSAPTNTDGPITPEQVEAMIKTLSERVKSNPDEVESWAMLGRAQAVLGRHAQAVPALQRAVALRGDDAALLTEYADALAVVNGRNLDGEPSRLLAKALTIEPNHPKALLLSGMHAFQQQDYAQALQRWEKVVQLSPGGDLAQQIQGVIEEARKRAGGAVPMAAPSAATATTTTAAVPGPTVSGTVTLAPALAAKARPDDTVFVFARAAEGPRMPLAILRKQVKDLPLAFTLDDSMAMSPAAKLSSAPRVLVGARISTSGNATPQPGDLQGFSAPVAPGATGLAIQITDVVATP